MVLEDYKPKVEMIQVRDIHEDQDNPNAMDQKEYDSLVKNIEHTKGLIDPLITMECNCDIIDKKPHRKIINGEHRWRAAQDERIGFSKVPCIDYLPQDELDDKFQLVALNKIKGKFITLKMAKLITSLAAKVPIEEIKSRMFLSDQELEGFLGKEDKALRAIAEGTQKSSDAITKQKSDAERKKDSTIGKVMFILQMDSLDKDYLDEAINLWTEKEVKRTGSPVTGNIRSTALGSICKEYLSQNSESEVEE